jgi:GNAT superfamily N-acetyltransferase
MIKGISIEQYQQLSVRHITRLEQLVTISKSRDGYSIKLPWEVIHKRETLKPCDWLIELEGQVIAYLGLFIFDNLLPQVSLLVHPQYRRQGIAKQLLIALLCLWYG